MRGERSPRRWIDSGLPARMRAVGVIFPSRVRLALSSIARSSIPANASLWRPCFERNSSTARPTASGSRSSYVAPSTSEALQSGRRICRICSYLSMGRGASDSPSLAQAALLKAVGMPGVAAGIWKARTLFPPISSSWISLNVMRLLVCPATSRLSDWSFVGLSPRYAVPQTALSLSMPKRSHASCLPLRIASLLSAEKYLPRSLKLKSCLASLSSMTSVS